MAALQNKVTVQWQNVVSLFVGFLLAGCNSSSRTPGARDPADGASVIPPLTGETATNHAQLVERLRHLPKKTSFERRNFISSGGTPEQMKYLLFKPKAYQTNQNYPLVLSLHGGAPRKNFEDLLEPYLPGLAYGLGRLVSDETQDQHPSFIVAPWSNNQGWDGTNQRLVMGLLAALQREFRIDAKRIYVTGQSMGGFGTWSIINDHPAYFAAAVPICGGGEQGDVPKTWKTPVWAFHGTADNVVPVHYTRRMISAVRKSGGTPLYWEYEGADHAGTAERAYSEPDLILWIFAQSKQ